MISHPLDSCSYVYIAAHKHSRVTISSALPLHPSLPVCLGTCVQRMGLPLQKCLCSGVEHEMEGPGESLTTKYGAKIFTRISVTTVLQAAPARKHPRRLLKEESTDARHFLPYLQPVLRLWHIFPFPTSAKTTVTHFCQEQPLTQALYMTMT